MANKMVVIDGVHYEISPADWKLQQQILSRATVVKGTDTSIVKTDKQNDTVLKNLIGHTNVVYYNFETNAWNTNNYNGYTIIDQDADTGTVKDFKSVMEKIPEFSRQYELAASITMTIDSISFLGRSRMVSNPKYSQNGTAVVGNIIVKNKATGKYELYSKSWVSVEDYFIQCDAVRCGAYQFAAFSARNSEFRAALIAAHER